MVARPFPVVLSAKYDVPDMGGLDYTLCPCVLFITALDASLATGRCGSKYLCPPMFRMIRAAHANVDRDSH